MTFPTFIKDTPPHEVIQAQKEALAQHGEEAVKFLQQDRKLNFAMVTAKFYSILSELSNLLSVSGEDKLDSDLQEFQIQLHQVVKEKLDGDLDKDAKLGVLSDMLAQLSEGGYEFEKGTKTSLPHAEQVKDIYKNLLEAFKTAVAEDRVSLSSHRSALPRK